MRFFTLKIFKEILVKLLQNIVWQTHCKTNEYLNLMQLVNVVLTLAKI